MSNLTISLLLTAVNLWGIVFYLGWKRRKIYDHNWDEREGLLAAQILMTIFASISNILFFFALTGIL